MNWLPKIWLTYTTSATFQGQVTYQYYCTCAYYLTITEQLQPGPVRGNHIATQNNLFGDLLYLVMLSGM